LIPEPSQYAGDSVIVADCDANAARAAELGGRICLPPKDIPTVGRIATFIDRRSRLFERPFIENVEMRPRS
jgi:predicted enzyme related to lactoylglutathione lyase